MKLVSCKVIEDLLPLYVEDMLNEASNELVETHLNECRECCNYLKELQEMESPPIETETKPLKKIQNTLQKKKWTAVILSIFITLLIGALTVVYMTAPDYLPYSEEVVTINETANGYLLADFNEEVAGYDLQSYTAQNGRELIYHLTTWSTTWNKLTHTQGTAPMVLNQNGEEVEAVYYYQTNESVDQLIYGEEQYLNGGVVTLPRLSLNYLSCLAFLAFLIFAGFTLAVRSNKIYFERMIKISGLPLSYLIAQLLVTGWDTITYSLVRDFAAILLVSILLYGVFWIVIEILKRTQ